jgi:hypothetical protein
MNQNLILNKNLILKGLTLSVVLGIGIYMYRNYCHHQTFKKIGKKFKQTKQWEKDLEIYDISLPKFYISGIKKHKCILLIGGYRDIPYIWNEFEKYLIEDKIDYYAPRTFGNGRSFYQIADWKDWVITYLEAIYILQEQYESIDIIGFSTGSVIAVYLTQFKYKCKINNLFLCAPFLTCKKYLSIDLTYSSNIFSKIFNRFYVWTLRFRPKTIGKFKNHKNMCDDFCEMFGDVLMETVLFDFIKFRPNAMYVENVVILYPNGDNIIGNIYEQKQIIENVYTSKPIDIISIPSYLNESDNNHLPKKSTHIMFKEKPEIIQDIYLNIKKYF